MWNHSSKFVAAANALKISFTHLLACSCSDKNYKLEFVNLSWEHINKKKVTSKECQLEVQTTSIAIIKEQNEFFN
jgi:hypothetical protein